MSFKDKTFCASPNCKNKCGRKMTENEKDQYIQMVSRLHFSIPVSYAYFCVEPEEEKGILNVK
jgi:hypothetical protein